MWVDRSSPLYQCFSSLLAELMQTWMFTGFASVGMNAWLVMAAAAVGLVCSSNFLGYEGVLYIASLGVGTFFFYSSLQVDHI